MNNRCRSAKLRAGAMTRMSNKLVYHFLRFNEPPAGVNRRGATLTRFLSSTHCIYGRDMGGIYIWERYMKNIWEGHANSKHSTPGLIRQVTLPSPPFFRFSSLTDFPEEEFMRFPCAGGFDRGRMCLGAAVGGKNIQRVQRRLHQLSCLARCNKPKMFWLRGRERGCKLQTWVSFTRSCSFF